MQTRRRFTPPFTTAFTRWMLALNRRRVTLCAWLTFRPNAGPFPHMSQRLAMVTNWSLLTGVSKPVTRRVHVTNYTRGPEIAGLVSFLRNNDPRVLGVTTVEGASHVRRCGVAVARRRLHQSGDKVKIGAVVSSEGSFCLAGRSFDALEHFHEVALTGHGPPAVATFQQRFQLVGESLSV